jgi:nucleoside-diphosphate-sugar epimerase
MNVLVTGGAGFIGSNLCEHHLSQGDTVYALDNLITGSERNIESLTSNPNFHFLNGDITTYDFSSIPKVEIVYNLASPASPIQYKKHSIETLMTNAVGVQNVLEYVRTLDNAVFVQASTSEVYGDPLEHPQTEEYWGNVNPNGVRACYDEGKRFAEALIMTYVRRYGIRARMARIFNTYGPNMEKEDGRVVSNFIMQAISGKPITVYGDGRQTRSFCYVSDMVDGLYKLATAKEIDGVVINIGNPDEKTVNELATIVKKLTGSSSEIVQRPIDEDDPKKRRPDISKAKNLLGWQPAVTLEDGLKKTITYFKERFA